MLAVQAVDELTLGAAFPARDRAAWRESVEKVLKGADFERRLVRTTADGIATLPLYTEAEAGQLRRAVGLPGKASFTRGSAPAAAQGWDIRQRHAHPDPATANAQILEDLEGGVASIQLRLARPGADDGVRADGPDALARTLDGVLLDLAPVGLDAGARFGEATTLLLGLYHARGHGGDAVRADLNADPFGAAVAGEPIEMDAALERAAALAAEIAPAWPGIVTLLADGRPYHAGGASEAQEIACAVATGIAYLRALEAAGLDPLAGGRQIGLALAADADFFLTVAKLRALRRLWARVLEVAGGTAAMPALRLHAETATRMATRRDPHVNILRATVAAFAAAAGGASSITVLPFDQALGLPGARARRLARNTHLVLAEESVLGHVSDPAGGSWYVETLTEALARKAWALVQEIEGTGGMAAALRAGLPQDLVADSWAALRAAVATRCQPVTGVSEFPDLAETSAAPDQRRAAPTGADGIGPIPPRRRAEPFERLRDRSDAILARDGERPRVFLCNLGRPADFAARADFARSLFEAGGIAAVTSEALTSPDDAGRAFAADSARLAAICSSDEVYAAIAEAAARALRQAGASRVFLMGCPDADLEATLKAAGVDEFVFAGADVLGVLERAHATLAGEIG